VQRELETLRAENAELAAKVAELASHNRILAAKIKFLLGRMFGSKSEKHDARQLELLLEGLAAGKPEEPPPPPPPSPPKPRAPREHKSRLPADLPTEDVVIEPEAVKQDPGAWRLIGEEVTEELDVEPARYFRRRIVRRKYASKLDRAQPPLVAPLPPRVVEGGYASPGLLADILVKKYVDHLPLHRQSQILKARHGIDLSRKTMADWVGICADWLAPVVAHVRDDVLADGYVQVDETPVKYCLREGGGSGQGYLWTYNRPGGGVFFEWHTGRSAGCLEGALDGYGGFVQCDGYAAYATFARLRAERIAQGGEAAPIELACCWAHVRRKFDEALAECPKLAGWFVDQIGLLYAVEKRVRGLAPVLRQAARAAESAHVAARLGKALRLKLAALRPKSAVGRAVAYALSLWPKLQVFLKDGRVEIDNNLVENAIRPSALGKKNWLFVGHPAAGKRAAVLYTLVENCRRLGINPQEYLADVLARLPSLTNRQTEALTPENWLAGRSQLRAA
jgi:transposase